MIVVQRQCIEAAEELLTPPGMPGHRERDRPIAEQRHVLEAVEGVACCRVGRRLRCDSAQRGGGKQQRSANDQASTTARHDGHAAAMCRAEICERVVVPLCFMVSSNSLRRIARTASTPS